MNRPIRFRAWHNQDKKMLEGKTLQDYFIGQREIGVAVAHMPDPDREKFLQDEFGHLDFQQFTGLLDKNGKEIYEGDIVDHVLDPNGNEIPKDKSYSTVNKIGWAGSGMTLIDRHDKPVTFLLDKKWGECIEVIGSIYENEDLLK